MNTDTFLTQRSIRQKTSISRDTSLHSILFQLLKNGQKYAMLRFRERYSGSRIRISPETNGTVLYLPSCQAGATSCHDRSGARRDGCTARSSRCRETHAGSACAWVSTTSSPEACWHHLRLENFVIWALWSGEGGGRWRAWPWRGLAWRGGGGRAFQQTPLPCHRWINQRKPLLMEVSRQTL